MPGGYVYAEVTVRDPGICQVAAVSDQAAAVRDVSQTALTNDQRVVTQELTLSDAARDAEVPAEPVDEPNNVYRLQRPKGQGCPCELVERHACPVRGIHAVDGRLSLTFYASDLDTIRGIIADLRTDSNGVSLQRLYQTGRGSSQELVYLDRGLLTDRQREVLQTAHEMGYFAHPKEANAGDVAAELSIATTTFVEQLSRAQSKLLDELLDGSVTHD